MLALVRSAGVLLVGWMMLGWTWTPYAEEPVDLIVLIDTSRSMATEDSRSSSQPNHQASSKKLSRLSAAKSLLLERQPNDLFTLLKSEFHPRAARFGERIDWLSSDPSLLTAEVRGLAAEDPSTQLGAALQETIRLQRGRTTAAIVLITDGVQTEGLPLALAAQEAKTAKIPLYIVGVGNDQPAKDLRITHVTYPSTVFLGDMVLIEAILELEGLPDSSRKVSLLSGKNEVLLTETVDVRAGRSNRIRLPIRPAELGDWNFKLAVESVEGDVNPENNLAAGTIQVREETVRVLLVDRRPRYDFRYLADLLSRARKRGAKTEAAFEIKTYLQEGDPGLSRQDPAALDSFPRIADLSQYHVIILGDVDPKLLGGTAQRDLLEAVTRQGVGLALLPDSQGAFRQWIDQPVELLLPARAADILPAANLDASHALALTGLGQQTPFCLLGDRWSQSDSSWKTFPTFWGLLTTTRLRPEIRILMETRDSRMEDGRASPVFTSHFVGAAKIHVSWFDEWWRWAGPASRPHYDQFWLQQVRSLCNLKSASLVDAYELSTDAVRYEEGAPIELTLDFRDESFAPADDQGVVVALRSSQAQRDVVLSREASRRGNFSSVVSQLPPGMYEATVLRPAVVPSTANRCQFEVTSRSDESARLRPDFAALRSAAQQSGGSFYTLDTAGKIPEDLPRIAALRTSPLPERSAWNLPVWAGILVGLFTLEWFLRRANGLI